MFIAALFIRAKKWEKTPKHPLTDEWINKMQYVHIKEYYSAISRYMLQHNEPWNGYANWKKLVTKAHRLYDSIYLKNVHNRQMHNQKVDE